MVNFNHLKDGCFEFAYGGVLVAGSGLLANRIYQSKSAIDFSAYVFNQGKLREGLIGLVVFCTAYNLNDTLQACGVGEEMSFTATLLSIPVMFGLLVKAAQGSQIASYIWTAASVLTVAQLLFFAKDCFSEGVWEFKEAFA